MFIKKFIKSLFTLPALLALLLGMMFATMLPVGVVDAQSKDEVCEGATSFVGGPGNCNEGDGQGAVEGTIQNFLNLFSAIIGVAAVFMMLYGGFRYITSGGDAGKVQAAQQTIIYGVVGLVVAALAQILVRFVLGQAVN